MNQVWNIARRDFRAFFTSPIAYIVTALFMAIMGWIFFNVVLIFNTNNMMYSQMNMGKAVSLTDAVLRPLYGNMNVMLLFMIPFITMRLFAEEKKSHTIEMLLTAPLTITQIVMGKFMAAFLFVSFMLSVTFVFPIILFIYGNPDPMVILTVYLGILLLSSVQISIGIFFSALTENQIVAGSLSIATTLLMWLLGWGSRTMSGNATGKILQYLTLTEHFEQFSVGVIQTNDIIFYLLMTLTGLFLTQQALDHYRWR